MGFSGVAKWAEGWEIWVPPCVSCVIGYTQGSGPFSWPIQLIYKYIYIYGHPSLNQKFVIFVCLLISVIMDLTTQKRYVIMGI